MKKKNFIPALKYPWLTRFFDPVLSFTMPEKKFRKLLIEQAGIKKDERILDFGCGTGTLSIMVKKTIPDATVIGLDVDRKILQIAKEKVYYQGLNISLERYNGKQLPYSDSSFDKVVSSLVFHHLDKEQKENSFKEIFRVLKPGGELHIADWGKAANPLMRLLFYLVQFLDGFKTTSDNVKGLLPSYMQNAGFWNVTRRKKINTVFGTLCLYSATKIFQK